MTSQHRAHTVLLRGCGRDGKGVATYLMGSCSWTSRNVRPRLAELCPSCPPLSFAPSLRSCWMSLRDSERPVPSYLIGSQHQTVTAASRDILLKIQKGAGSHCTAWSCPERCYCQGKLDKCQAQEASMWRSRLLCVFHTALQRQLLPT